MRQYALDSNIVSYLLKKDIAVWEKYNQDADSGREFIIPAIVYYEVKRGLLAIDAPKKLKSFEKMCSEFGVGRMTTAAWDEAARLYALHRKSGRTVDDSDLFIAAFCITSDHVLVTHNTKHFVGIEGLELIDWK